MKQGFLLIEALIAIVLLSLCSGIILHHYGQWAQSYKRAIEQAKALTLLVRAIEEESSTCAEPELYTLSVQEVPLEEPGGSLRSIPGIQLPVVLCKEFTMRWQGDLDNSKAISAIMGDW